MPGELRRADRGPAHHVLARAVAGQQVAEIEHDQQRRILGIDQQLVKVLGCGVV